MALETATYIDDLVSTNPTATDTVAQADDHIRLIKAALQATFPNITGAMTATHTVLNGLDARLSTVEASLYAPSGTRMLFQQTTAPTGWTKDTTHNNKALRVVSGTAGTGGTVGFTTAFASQSVSGSISNTVSGSTAGHTLTVSEMPSHSHSITSTARKDGGSPPGGSFPHGSSFGTDTVLSEVGLTLSIDNTGGDESHSHDAGTLAVSSAFTGTSIDMAVQYVDVIVAQKD